jgi:endonuclease YncB( thermonuclease family)
VTAVTGMLRVLLWFVILFLGSTTAQAETAKTITGQVVSVDDGNTLEISTTDGLQKVTLMGALAPTGTLPYSDESKRILSDIALNKHVWAWLNGGTFTAAEGRPAEVRLENEKGQHINDAMLLKGAALSMQSRCSDMIMGWDSEERLAKSSKNGLWSLPVEQQQLVLEARTKLQKPCAPQGPIPIPPNSVTEQKP